MNRFSFAASCIAFAVTFSQPAAAGLFGPASEPLQSDALMQKLRSAPVVLNVRGNLLHIRSKGGEVGGFLLGMIAGSALASGTSSGPSTSAQQLQRQLDANVQIATTFSQNVNSAIVSAAEAQTAKPQAQVAKEGPVLAVSQELLASLSQVPQLNIATAGAERSASAADLQLTVSQPQWQLDYSMLSSDYTLRYNVSVQLYQKESDTIYFKESCQGEYGEKMPQEEWERDEFGALQNASREIAKRCAAELQGKLGLATGAVAMAEEPTGTVPAVVSSAPTEAGAPAVAGEPAADTGQ
ncbi:hypothetical protein Dsui_2155 [Azospira oryzae PS]|uniref:Lipoprotein n=1 Tax=Azospira oryzae (strain ATCC BAA-33 / DSM 13638 / PS) TaxID=640081 RepID=G8QJP7_AZOOP|nr:hypothetical protein [Azospira oryzae]AEV26521.1 hypothetical protein Dsui_2155 [Azospira oryzae PS]